jgi:pilus assembly protein CpaC
MIKREMIKREMTRTNFFSGTHFYSGSLFRIKGQLAMSPMTKLASSLLAALFAVMTFSGAVPARGQEASNKTFETRILPNPKLQTTTVDQGNARRIDLQVGKSIVLDLPRDAKEVFVANPGIANAMVRSARKIYIIGVATGTTTIFVNDADGQQIAVLDMTVARELGRELSVLKDLMKTTFPRAVIDVRSVGTSFVLSGEVDSALEAQRAIDIATSLTAGIQTNDSGAAAGGAAASSTTASSKVINALHVRGRDQVMIKVTVSEVEKTMLKHLGVETSGQWTVGSSVFNLATTQLDTDNPTASAVRSGGKSAVSATLRALEQQGAFHTLAEPTLTAISGESAKFLAGGEIPIPIRTCTNGICNDTVEYKPIGVTLAFTPVVLSEGRISLSISTEVTDRDDSNSVTSNGLNIPGFKTNRTNTTVELPSGGSLVTAGLIQNRSSVTVNGVPGIMNIPILGALARSRQYQSDQSELMIVVVPYIVKAIEPGAVPHADEGFADARDPAGIFLNRVNRLYGTSSTPRNTQSYKGNIGFITE